MGFFYHLAGAEYVLVLWRDCLPHWQGGLLRGFHGVQYLARCLHLHSQDIHRRPGKDGSFLLLREEHSLKQVSLSKDLQR